MLKKFPSDKINVTINALALLLQAPIYNQTWIDRTCFVSVLHATNQI